MISIRNGTTRPSFDEENLAFGRFEQCTNVEFFVEKLKTFVRETVDGVENGHSIVYTNRGQSALLFNRFCSNATRAERTRICVKTSIIWVRYVERRERRAVEGTPRHRRRRRRFSYTSTAPRTRSLPLPR